MKDLEFKNMGKGSNSDVIGLQKWDMLQLRIPNEKYGALGNYSGIPFLLLLFYI